MTITYPLALPAGYPARVSLRGRAVVGVSESPFSYAQQVYAHTGQRWEADIELPPMYEHVADKWVAWLLSLNGRQGTFLMGDPSKLAPRGIGGGTPLVMGAGQSGQTLAIDGCPTTTVGWLLAGDMIQLGSGSTATLHKVLVDANTNGSGEVTLDIWPRLRSVPADNAPVTIVSPVGRWRLASNEMAWSVGVAKRYGISFVAVEAL
jgi:hypothetical protein